MALLEVYAVWDAAVKAFGRPMFFRSRGEALRTFMDECDNKDSVLNKHSSDYSLYQLSVYDELDGSFLKKTEPPELVITARECVGKEKGGN